MRIVQAGATEIIEQDILKKIELCGRICYKSEEKITETSHIKFVKKLIDRQHLAMLEHAPVVLSVTARVAKGIKKLGHGTFLNVTLNDMESRYLVSGNVRAWYILFTNTAFRKEAEEIIVQCEKYMQISLGKEVYSLLFPNLYSCSSYSRDFILTQEQVLALPNLKDYEAMAHLYLTAHFICDRGVSHELVRHRPASFAQESTRYCNYAQDKHGNEITVIDPGFTGMPRTLWEYVMGEAESAYFNLLSSGYAPQEARGVLPTDLKTEVVMSCSLGEWQHVINLRYHGTTGAPHPHMKAVMAIWYNIVMNKEGYNVWLK